MNNEPTFVKLLCLSVGTSVTISIALGTGFGLAGVVIGVVLGVLGGTIIGIVLTARRSTRSGGANTFPAAALLLTFALVLLVGLLTGNASLGETVSSAAAVLGVGLLESLLLWATQNKL